MALLTLAFLNLALQLKYLLAIIISECTLSVCYDNANANISTSGGLKAKPFKLENFECSYKYSVNTSFNFTLDLKAQIASM